MKEKIKKITSRWFITAFSGMAQGLFCTLIAGTIIALIAQWVTDGNVVGRLLGTFATLAKILMGAGIGIGIACKFKLPPLVAVSGAVSGMVGAFAAKIIAGAVITTPGVLTLAGPGEPLGGKASAESDFATDDEDDFLA